VNRWAKIVWTMSAAAAVGWIGAGALGYRVEDQRTLALHTLASFVALLALLLTQVWMAVFALASRTLVARATGGRDRALASAARWLLLASLFAIGAATAQFTISNALFPAKLRAKSHAQAAAASIVVVFAALVVEARALRGHGRTIEEIERCVLDSAPSHRLVSR
jgi:hypothetical protein